MAEDENLATFTLQLGGTRPALMPYLGIPWSVAVVFGVATMELLIIRWQLTAFLIPPFLIAVILCRRDYNAGRCFVCWMRTTGRHLSAASVGGTFLSPFPAAKPRRFRGMR